MELQNPILWLGARLGALRDLRDAGAHGAEAPFQRPTTGLVNVRLGNVATELGFRVEALGRSISRELQRGARAVPTGFLQKHVLDRFQKIGAFFSEEKKIERPRYSYEFLTF